MSNNIFSIPCEKLYSMIPAAYDTITGGLCSTGPSSPAPLCDPKTMKGLLTIISTKIKSPDVKALVANLTPNEIKILSDNLCKVISSDCNSKWCNPTKPSTDNLNIKLNNILNLIGTFLTDKNAQTLIDSGLGDLGPFLLKPSTQSAIEKEYTTVCGDNTILNCIKSKQKKNGSGCTTPPVNNWKRIIFIVISVVVLLILILILKFIFKFNIWIAVLIYIILLSISIGLIFWDPLCLTKVCGQTEKWGDGFNGYYKGVDTIFGASFTGEIYINGSSGKAITFTCTGSGMCPTENFLDKIPDTRFTIDTKNPSKCGYPIIGPLVNSLKALRIKSQTQPIITNVYVKIIKGQPYLLADLYFITSFTVNLPLSKQPGPPPCPKDKLGNECGGTTHGTCDTGTCSCKAGWTGPDCSTKSS
jgi:hypothetical protein